MFSTVWKFVVRADAIEAFERHYRADGTWSELFRTSPDYLGTELYRDVDHPHEYLTIDRWTSENAYRAFREEHASEYAALDRETENLTISEEHIG